MQYEPSSVAPALSDVARDIHKRIETATTVLATNLQAFGDHLDGGAADSTLSAAEQLLDLQDALNDCHQQVQLLRQLCGELRLLREPVGERHHDFSLREALVCVVRMAHSNHGHPVHLQIEDLQDLRIRGSHELLGDVLLHLIERLATMDEPSRPRITLRAGPSTTVGMAAILMEIQSVHVSFETLRSSTETPSLPPKTPFFALASAALAQIGATMTLTGVGPDHVRLRLELPCAQTRLVDIRSQSITSDTSRLRIHSSPVNS
jgi:hypothetical protein